MSSTEATFPYAGFLDQFEEAIYWHIAWYSRGIRHLMFSNGAGDDLVGKDAHLHCRLGGFLSRFPTPPGCAEMVEQIDELHEQMHALMRDALLERREGTPIGEDAYAEIEEMQSMFFSSLHGLFRKVMEDHCLEIARQQLEAQAAS
ncbi:MAG: CZB domain-containing protein [Pseudomonadota bacterium]